MAASSSALKDSRFGCSRPNTGCQMTVLRDGVSKIDGGMQSQHGERELISVEEKGDKVRGKERGKRKAKSSSWVSKPSALSTGKTAERKEGIDRENGWGVRMWQDKRRVCAVSMMATVWHRFSRIIMRVGLTGLSILSLILLWRKMSGARQLMPAFDRAKTSANLYWSESLCMWLFGPVITKNFEYELPLWALNFGSKGQRKLVKPDFAD